MRMRILALLALCPIACDQGALPPAPKAEPIVVKPAVATTLPPPEAMEAVESPPLLPPPEHPPRDFKRWHGIPLPPSIRPKLYLPWLDTLSDDDKQLVDSFCKKHPQDFQVICGGIGPLHIPYPPFVRARILRDPTPELRSFFRSPAAWEASLSLEQKQYFQRECAGDEDRPSSDLCGDNTPLVIAFGNERVSFVADGTFDYPTAATPWLVLDRDGNGTIDGAGELFGSSTVLADGSTAMNGFVALAELDANHDGTIDAQDPAFARLQLWADRDRDRKGTTGELTAAASSIVSISLTSHVDLHCDARANCEGERATITWRDAEGLHDGSVVDVYLPGRRTPQG